MIVSQVASPYGQPILLFLTGLELIMYRSIQFMDRAGIVYIRTHLLAVWVHCIQNSWILGVLKRYKFPKRRVLFVESLCRSAFYCLFKSCIIVLNSCGTALYQIVCLRQKRRYWQFCLDQFQHNRDLKNSDSRPTSFIIFLPFKKFRSQKGIISSIKKSGQIRNSGSQELGEVLNLTLSQVFVHFDYIRNFKFGKLWTILDSMKYCTPHQ